MLDSLDNVPWDTLTHAYGAASDVPRLVRDLAGDDAEARAQALHALYGNVYHQYDRFPATPHVVRFLWELVLADGVSGKAELIALLAHLVAGPCSVRDGFTLADGERTVFFGETRAPQPHEAQGVSIHRACYEAGLPFVDAALALVRGESDSLRLAAPFYLAWFRTRRADILPVLEAQLAIERFDDVRASIVFAQALLAEPEEFATLLMPRLGPSECLIVQTVSAMMYAWRAPAQVPPEVLVKLELGLAFVQKETGGYYAGLPFGHEGLAGDIGHVLAGLPVGAAVSAFQSLLAALPHTDGVSLIGVVRGLLAMARSDEGRRRAALAGLLYHAPVFRLGNVFALLEEAGVPQERAALAQSLGLPMDGDVLGRDALAAGIAAAHAGDMVEALALFERASALRPDDPIGPVNVVFALRSLGRMSEARDAAKQASQVFDCHPPLRFEHALAAHLLGDYEEAIAAGTTGLRLQEGNSNGRYTLACSYALAGRPDEAIAELTRVLTEAPDYLADMEKDADFTSLHALPMFQRLRALSSQESDSRGRCEL